MKRQPERCKMQVQKKKKNPFDLPADGPERILSKWHPLFTREGRAR